MTLEETLAVEQCVLSFYETKLEDIASAEHPFTDEGWLRLFIVQMQHGAQKARVACLELLLI